MTARLDGREKAARHCRPNAENMNEVGEKDFAHDPASALSVHLSLLSPLFHVEKDSDGYRGPWSSAAPTVGRDSHDAIKDRSTSGYAEGLRNGDLPSAGSREVWRESTSACTARARKRSIPGSRGRFCLHSTEEIVQELSERKFVVATLRARFTVKGSFRISGYRGRVGATLQRFHVQTSRARYLIQLNYVARDLRRCVAFHVEPCPFSFSFTERVTEK